MRPIPEKRTSVKRRQNNNHRNADASEVAADTKLDGANRSVARALAILVDVARQQKAQSFADFQKRLQLPKATLHKLLLTLEALNFIARDRDSGRYSLGLAMLELLASGGARTGDIRSIIQPFLKEVVDRCNETGHIGILDGAEEILFERIDPPNQVVRLAMIGRRHPAHGSAGGLASLAARGESVIAELPEHLKQLTKNTVATRAQLIKRLADVRRKGYAIEMEEVYPGVRCIGVAIDVPGWPVASISLSLPVQRASRERLEQLAPPLIAAAKDIQRILAVTPRT